MVVVELGLEGFEGMEVICMVNERRWRMEYVIELKGKYRYWRKNNMIYEKSFDDFCWFYDCLLLR